MNIKPIKTEQDYKNTLIKIDSLFTNYNLRSI